MKRSTHQSIGFFSDTKRAKVAPQNADAALATIPVVPHYISIFHYNEEDPWKKCYSAHETWDKLANPVTTIPGHHVGLNNLRELAQQGVATAIPYNEPQFFKSMFTEVHQLLAAGPVVYADPLTQEQKLPGVVFHPGNSTLTAHIRGEANPHLGFGRQHGYNKLWEWQFVSRIDPTAMAETIAMDELPIWAAPKLVELRYSIRESLDQIVQRKPRKLERLFSKELTCYIKNIFAALRTKFPEGAFIKPVESSCSSDYENKPITTMTTHEETLAMDFVKGIPSVLQKLSDTQTLESPMLRTILLSESKPIFLVVYDLLFNPREIIGQAALKIAKTEAGSSFEVRVDFMQGKALYSWMRYEYSVYPQETQAAADFLDQFFKKAKYKNRMLCGGADIALGQDGNWHIIEFNLGAESMGLKLGTRWNCYVSSFLGRNTELINTFESIFAAPLEEQKKFLSGLQQSVLNHPKIDDIPEVCQWFAERYCQLFSTHPTFLKSYVIISNLKDLFSVVSPKVKGWINPLIDSTAAYMKRELSKKKYFADKPLFFSKDNLQSDSVTSLRENTTGLPRRTKRSSQ